MAKLISDQEAHPAPPGLGSDLHSKPLPKVAKLVAGFWIAIVMGGLPLVVILPHGTLNDGEIILLVVAIAVLVCGLGGAVGLLTRRRGGRYLLELTSWATAGVMLVAALFLM